MNTAVENFSVRAYRSSVAMTVTLISWGMLFAALFLGYFLLRFNSAMWPPVELENLPVLLPTSASVLVFLSSWSYAYYQKNPPRRTLFLWVTLILGNAFVLNQVLLWNELKLAGIVVQNGMISSMVYAFTWLHVAHMALGIMALLWMGSDHLRRKEISLLKVINVGKFWHFLGAVWFLMYLLLFIL